MLSETGYMSTLAIAGAVKERVGDYEAEIAAMKEHIRILTTALAVETANGFALEKVAETWEKHHPNSPIMNTERFTYRDGTPKTIGKALFQKHFDEKLKELGITNPVQYRQD